MRIVLASAMLIAASVGALADQYVNGYYRSNGTYVAPHYRSSPDSTRLNNWSTQGNTNPYTGQAGTKSPYATGNGGWGTSGRTNSLLGR